MLHVAIGLLPVLFFLTGLVLVDSYQLVGFRAVVTTVIFGCLAAVGAYYVNTAVVEISGLSREDLITIGAPLIEEAFKAGFVALLILSDRIGFSIDAAVYGFAAGAGFAVIENLFYLNNHPEMSTTFWMVRGFGTAIMHGGSATVFALIAKTGYDFEPKRASRPFIWAFLASALIHSAYNQLMLSNLSALLVMAVQITGFTVLIGFLVVISERKTRDWLGSGFDTDQELLNLLVTGEISQTRVGSYLRKLKTRFAGPIVADMLCLIRIRVELSLQAKGLLMMREAGFRVTAAPDIKAKFEELKYLESTIGRVGLLAIEPIHRWSKRDLWQLSLLDDS